MAKIKKRFLEKIFSLLNQRNIDYFVYGEYDHLPDNNGGSDIDMIISPEDFAQGISILRGVSLDLGVNVVSYYHGPYSCFVRFMTTEWGVQFDIISAFFHKDKIYYPTEYLKNDIVIHNNVVKALIIEVGYYVDFLKELTHIHTVKEKYVRGFITEYIRNPRRREQLKVLYGEDFVGIIDNHLDYDSMLDVLPALRNIVLKKLHPYTISIEQLKRRVISLKRLYHPPGYVVAVLGTDGSGKTTIIQGITPILNEAFHKGVKYNHLRPHWLPDIGVLTGRRKKKDQKEVCSAPHSSKPSGLIGSFFRWGYYLFDYTIGYLIKIWKYKHTKSHVYIFDRYYYDYYIDQRRLRIQLPKWIVKIGDWIVPTPDIILCLGGNPDAIYHRKPETTKDEVERQVAALRSFCNNHQHTAWIDTTETVETSIHDAMVAIHSMMSKRFEGVVIK